jgi:hypothetical protein
LLSSSIKAGLDINWNDPEQKDEAIERLAAQLGKLNDWPDRNRLAAEEPLKPYIEALAQVQKQDLEMEKGRIRLRRAVAEGRRVPIEDPDMRHGRKSKSKRFNGYKQHLATELALLCPLIAERVGNGDSLCDFGDGRQDSAAASC